MLQPGLGRATAFGLLGFMTGNLLVLIIRSLQGLDPLFDPSVGLVIGGFLGAIFFIWGIGAFNPLWSAHGTDEAEAHRVIAERATEPRRILTATIWSLIGWLLLMLILIIVFATLPFGFALTVTADPVASTSSVGSVYITINDVTIAVSQMVVLLVFIGVMFVSLFLLAWAIGNSVVGLNRGYVVASQEAGLKPGPSPILEALPPGEPSAEPAPKRERSPLMRTIRQVVLFVVVFTVLYLLFYYVAIGLIFPTEPWLTILSLTNALIFTVLIIRPAAVLLFIGWMSAQLARFVRWLPKILFQRG